MTIGITIFGMIQKNDFTRQLDSAFAGLGDQMPSGSGMSEANSILSKTSRSQIPPDILAKITDSLSDSIVHTFMWALVPAVLAFMFIFLMGNERVIIAKKPKPRVQKREVNQN